MRYPSAAGRFYPMNHEELKHIIESSFVHELGPGMLGACTGERKISAALCPHAGYSVSGMNAAHTFKAIAEDGLPEAYIVIGPDHYGVPFDTVMCSEDYLTPFGPCKIHAEIATELREMIPDSVIAHRAEHSIEVEIPFIQYIDPDPHIIPIIMGRQDINSAKRLAEYIAVACKGHDVVILASSDLAHYVPKDIATRLNTEVLDKLSVKDIDGMYSEIQNKRISVCGYGPIATAVFVADPKEIKILKYSDSWDSIHYDRDAVVGYGSAIMIK